ncbi:MAG TPA: DmsE family decaheme c-type cytochrome [Usitatibacter sp.]|nr:DmsE family decaheme c-type cytochrome [Usitatibacter sp.]
MGTTRKCLPRVAALAFVIALFAAPAPHAAAATPAPETCKNCHAEQVEAYEASVHGKKAHGASPAAAAGCGSCHGNVAEHAASRGKVMTGVVNPGSAALPVAEREKPCLACHGSSTHLAFWDSGKHRKNDVACANCHSVHGGKTSLLKIDKPQIAPLVNTAKVPQQEVCFNCHRDIRSLVMRPSHHPIVEGKVKCTSCHNPHGALSPAMVNSESIKDLCTSCHADKRGPFIHEHPPVEESCLNCHNPHGSRSVKLLNEKVPNLCQDCHDAAQHPGTMYDADANFRAPVGPTSGPNTRFIARSCLNCHVEIHGSNSPAARGRRLVR